jgi:hypothetical protein
MSDDVVSNSRVFGMGDYQGRVVLASSIRWRALDVGTVVIVAHCLRQ